MGLTALTVLWAAALGLDGEEGQALTERLGTEGTVSVIVLVIVVTVVGPVGEELLFRGYIVRALRDCAACGRRRSRRACCSGRRTSDGCRSR